MKKTGTFMILLGVLAILSAVVLTGYNRWDEARAGSIAEDTFFKLKLPKQTPAKFTGEGQDLPDYILNPDMEMPFMEVDGIRYVGALRIPSLGYTLPVTSECEDELMKIAPCRYCGTAYKPGFVIAGHNYSTHFGYINSLSPGEDISFEDVRGNVFTYKVVQMEILNPTDVELMKSDEWDLTLFTCTRAGTQRVTIRCKYSKA